MILQSTFFCSNIKTTAQKICFILHLDRDECEHSFAHLVVHATIVHTEFCHIKIISQPLFLLAFSLHSQGQIQVTSHPLTERKNKLSTYSHSTE